MISNKKLSYTWIYSNYEGHSDVSFELIPEGEKTRVKATHTGLETFPQDNKDFARTSFQAGWTEFIGTSLRNMVEMTHIHAEISTRAAPEKI